MIGMVYAQAPRYKETDWPTILHLYDRLVRAWPSPVVALSRAVVLSMTEGPESALREVERLEANPRLVGYHYRAAIKGDLLKRMDRDIQATQARQATMQWIQNAIERAAVRRAAARGPTNPDVGTTGPHLRRVRVYPRVATCYRSHRGGPINLIVHRSRRESPVVPSRASGGRDVTPTDTHGSGAWNSAQPPVVSYRLSSMAERKIAQLTPRAAQAPDGPCAGSV